MDQTINLTPDNSRPFEAEKPPKVLGTLTMADADTSATNTSTANKEEFKELTLNPQRPLQGLHEGPHDVCHRLFDGPGWLRVHARNSRSDCRQPASARR